MVIEFSLQFSLLKDLKLGPGLPLRAEKAIEKGEGDWEADVTVVVPPKAENAGISLPGSPPSFLKA